MAAERDFDAFLFHVERWFGSITQQRMSFAEKGVYLVMMFQQWREKGRNLPDNSEAIADLIANTEAQAAEVIAAWPVVRRKFVTSKHDDARIYNVEIEHTRRAQRKKRRETSDAARVAGKASGSKRKAKAAKYLSGQELAINGRSTPVQRPFEKSNGNEQIEETDRGNRGKEIERAIPRAHTGTAMDGMLPRDHQNHVFCNLTFAVCVPSSVHAKFIGSLLVPKFGGDRQAAHDGLIAWYRAVAETLPPDAVMGDAYRFWQPQFDAKWAMPVLTAKNKPEVGSTVPSAAETRRLRDREQPS